MERQNTDEPDISRANSNTQFGEAGQRDPDLDDPKLRKYLDEEQIVELKGVFEMFDVDGSGAIDVKELKQVMQNLGMNPTDEEVARMMAEADEDQSGEIDFNEFAQLMGKKMAENEQDEELVEVFKLFDKDGDGMLDAADLKQVFIELGMSDDQMEDNCELLIKVLDPKEPGKLNFPEFVQAFMAR